MQKTADKGSCRWMTAFAMPRSPTAPDLIRVAHQRGIHLPEADLWLDPPFAAARAFVSHAHSDHVARHQMAICTELTRQLMLKRGSAGKRTEFRTLSAEQSLEVDGFELRLLPAGHILGSAMLHITRLRDGATLLYTGDYKLRQGITGEAAELRPADTLIMETTFGLPRYKFPPVAEIAESMVRFARETIAAGQIPVLLGYSLGKAQEILAAMRAVGHPIMLHSSVMAMTGLLAPHLGELPAYSALDADHATGHVLILPPNAPQVDVLRQLGNCRMAMVTGWGLDQSAKYRHRVDEVFPLSDHADYPELIQTVETVKPRLVYTVHGFTREFAADLRQRGYDARALGREEQLDFLL